MDIQQKTTEIESELLAVIIQHLKNHQIDVSTASQLARDFLAQLPLQNHEDLLAKLKALSDHYPTVKPLYSLEASKGIEEKEKAALQQMSSSIKEGNIDHAISVAKSLQNQQE
jgi:hypothetical protein